MHFISMNDVIQKPISNQSTWYIRGSEILFMIWVLTAPSSNQKSLPGFSAEDIWTPSLSSSQRHYQIYHPKHMVPLVPLSSDEKLQYIPRNMHTVFALLCFVAVIHWLIFPYPSGLLHWHCSNLTIAPVPAKQPWWIWINTSCEFIMYDCITTTKQSTTKPCAYFLGYTVWTWHDKAWHPLYRLVRMSLLT